MFLIQLKLSFIPESHIKDYKKQEITRKLKDTHFYITFSSISVYPNSVDNYDKTEYTSDWFKTSHKLPCTGKFHHLYCSLALKNQHDITDIVL